MRNLREYPITKEEVLEVLDRAIKSEENKQVIGSIDQMVLQAIRDTVTLNTVFSDMIVDELHV